MVTLGFRWPDYTPPHWHRCLKVPVNSQVNWAIFCVKSYLTGKLSKLRSFDRQYRWPQSSPFQSSFTQRTAQFTQGIPRFLSLPAHTTMASSQDTSVSSNSFGRWTSHDIFLFKYHFLLHILRFLSFFSDNIMADVASKQQTTALFLTTTAARKRRHKELIKNWYIGWENCAVPENIQFSYSCSFFTQLNCTV